VPAIRELTGYSVWSYATMNPAASMGMVMKQFPGFADTLESLIKEMHQGTTLLRMHMDMFMPAMAAMLQRTPAGSNSLGAFDPESPFMEINQEAAEISTALVPDSVFKIPEGYQEVVASEMFKGLIARQQVSSASDADVNSILNATRSAQSAKNLAAAEDGYNAAFERAISNEKQRLSPVALEVATFFMGQGQPEKAEAALQRALDAEDAAGQPVSMEIPVLMRLRDVEQSRRNVALAPVETRLVKAWESLAGPESVVVANNLYSLSGSLEQAGQLVEAEQAIQRGIAILERNYGSNAPSVGLALGRLASIQTKLGKDDLAKEARNRETAIRQKPSAQNASRVGGSVTAPRVISKRDPEYTETARKAKIQGAVMLSLVVDSNGEPDDIAVLLPLGQGLDERAVEAVKGWRFQPGTKDGQPVRVQATIEVNFRLL
jgi:TonB family protein